MRVNYYETYGKDKTILKVALMYEIKEDEITMPPMLPDKDIEKIKKILEKNGVYMFNINL